MAVLFTRVRAERNGVELDILCCGKPETARDLLPYTKYQDFLAELGQNHGDITYKCTSYIYGEDSEVDDADIYMIASFERRGERFYKNPTVRIHSEYVIN
jgi:hypothetical protein